MIWAVAEFGVAAFWAYRAVTWVAGAPVDTLSAVIGAGFVVVALVRIAVKDWRHARALLGRDRP